MSEKRFKTKYYLKGKQGVVLGVVKVNEEENVLHWNDVVDLLNEQEQKIQKLESENDNMNLFIKQTIEPLLSDCVFELSTIESWSQVELAKKIENEIIPFIQDFKYLKYESLEEEKQDKSE